MRQLVFLPHVIRMQSHAVRQEFHLFRKQIRFDRFCFFNQPLLAGIFPGSFGGFAEIIAEHRDLLRRHSPGPLAVPL